MNKIYLLFGLHNHQPVGNFEHVFSEAYDKCYLPTLEMLCRYPQIRVSLHHSGPLLEWLERSKPEYLENLAAMAASGQADILSGGFYEPILSSLPERDAIGQIRLMNDWIEKKFGISPRGAWLAERIWDPIMPKILASAGIEFTLLDDTHFYYAGLSEKDMFGYWMTEKHGYPLAVFPIDKTMRYSIPFKLPEESLNYFRGVLANRGTTGVTYGDDGEKFGVWPETHEWVFGKRWLENFLNMLSLNSGEVETLTHAQFLDKFPPNGRIYLPMASYEEMMHWTLPTDIALKHTKLLHDLEEEHRLGEFRQFLRGGQWDNFLTKYEEANRLHKRMLYVSKRVAQASEKSRKGSEMTTPLYRGQCNCPYWHGLFGGLYLSNLRHAVYSNLIEAGQKADRILHRGKKWVEARQEDFLMSGQKDIIVETGDLFMLVTPADGGSVAEIDFKPSRFNLSNVMTRQPEEYHQKIVEATQKTDGGKGQILSIHDRVVFKEPALDKKLIFDGFTRKSFIEHILGEKPAVDDFVRGSIHSIIDQPRPPYAVQSLEVKAGKATVVLSRSGKILTGGNAVPASIEKRLTISAAEPDISCEYRITNGGKEALEFFFAVEWNFTLLASDALDRYITIDNERYKMNHKGENGDVKSWSMTDEYFRFSAVFECNFPLSLITYPIETVSQSEGGFESSYQGTCFLALLPVRILGGKTLSRDFRVRIEEL